jgi:hypothetical protein
VVSNHHRRHRKAISPQQFLNGEVHDWYRIVHGYSDHLVADLLKKFHITGKQKVLDPFCGAGTTLVECCKSRIACVGIDPNPSSYFAARVKTDWNVRPSKLLALLPQTADHYDKLLRKPETLKEDPTYRYILDSGMIDRKWISSKRLLKAIAIKRAINRLDATRSYKDALRLALVTEVVNTASNVRFGPELYCGEPRKQINLFESFWERVREMSRDLGVVRDMPWTSASVLRGDARDCASLLKRNGCQRFHAVICSPPYPAEHDYTRNARLELAFLEAVLGRDSLRKIKRQMIRSHTKGIYRGDDDSSLVQGNLTIARIARKIDRKARGKSHGFARLYSKVLQEYFGGMKRHFESVQEVLTPGAMCAYIVGDQSSYLRVHVPTAKILCEIAEATGFETMGIERWRSRWSTTTSKRIDENILILRNRKKRRHAKD